jgi:hypothetical protein
MTTRGGYITIGVLSVVLLALAVFTVVKVNDLNSRVSKLDSSTSELQKETSGEDQVALREQETNLKDATAKLKKIETCLPELQTEVSSMQLEHLGTEYYVSTNAQVSSYCSPTVYGSGP